jgi:NADH dehydrogenase
LFKNDNNVNITLSEVVGVNKDTKQVILKNKDVVDYDQLIISTGASYTYFGNDNWATYSNGLKNINDALDIRDGILKAFEKAENETNKDIQKKYLNFVVIGGGPTGVELAGSIAEIAFKNIGNEYRNFNSTDSNVYLVEAGNNILPAYSTKLSNKASNYLEKLGVIIKTNEKVENIVEMTVTTDKGKILSDNIIWAAGNKASSLIEHLDTDMDTEGRAIINPDCSIKEDENIFVIGDAANFKNVNGVSLPGIAPVAIQQGRYVGLNIKKNISKDNRKPFVYKDKGMMATIGGFKAIGVVGKFEISGFIAWLFWSLIHLIYLIGYKSKILVAVEWIFAFFLNKRGTRLIYRNTDK